MIHILIKEDNMSRNIEKLDRNTIREIKTIIENSLEDELKKKGISLEIGDCCFDDNNATYKVKISVLENGVAKTKERQDFKKMAPLYGLKENDLDKTFTFKGKQYTIIGFLRKAKKYQILVKREDDKKFKFPISIVKSEIR
ncbi:MAG: hypothetical protein ACOCP8_02730 [archaeon]